MADESFRFQEVLAAVERDVRAWRRAHPEATLTEIEQRLDAGLRQARADLLAEVAADAPDDVLRCPGCGGRLVRRGERTRTLRTPGDVPLPLTRSYGWCPACAAGVFPPR
jgi:hypothetical protein